MKNKRSLVFWVVLYVLEFVGALAIILFNREDWIFNAWSAFPLFYLLAFAFLIWYLPSIWNYRRSEDAWTFDRLWHCRNFDERAAYMRSIARERDGTWEDPMWSFMSRVCAALLPMYLLFIFFGIRPLKIASFVFGVLIYISLMLFWCVVLSGELKEAKEHRRKRQKELEEQQKREELGKWK